MFSVVCLLIVPVIFFGDLWIKNHIEKYIPARGGKREKKAYDSGFIFGFDCGSDSGIPVQSGTKGQSSFAAGTGISAWRRFQQHLRQTEEEICSGLSQLWRKMEVVQGNCV